MIYRLLFLLFLIFPALGYGNENDPDDVTLCNKLRDGWRPITEGDQYEFIKKLAEVHAPKRRIVYCVGDGDNDNLLLSNEYGDTNDPSTRV